MRTGGGCWYVVHTHPHAEARAQEHLRRQGFTTYLPLLLKARSHARKTDRVSRPLFPRYLFVMVDSTQQRWHSIRSTFGVANLVGGQDGPTALCGDIVETLRQRECADGHIRLEPNFARGAAVRVLDGIFASCLGLFECMSERDRVAVLLEFLGRRVRVVLDAESVAAA